MKYKRIAALLMTVVMAMSLTACGGETDLPAGDTTATTTTTTTTVVEPEVYVITATSVFVRSGPSTDSEKIGSLFQGDEVELLGQEETWCRIAYNGGVGYVMKTYVGVKGATDVTLSGTTEVTTTTTTKSTNQKPGTTTSPKYDDRYIDENGMLQFEPGNNYVQATSYADSSAIPWNLMLVNDWNPMKEGYDESVTMKTVTQRAVNSSQKVDARMYDDLMAMLEAGKAYNIGVQSSYRPYAKQKDLYWRQVNQWKGKYSDPVEVQTRAGEVVKRPGFSEHNTGLAVDLYGSGDHSLTESFANTDAYRWLMANCADYGFVLRFPKGKESITGVIYEAWHFRYVGDPTIAHEIMDNGWCLEEYLAREKK